MLELDRKRTVRIYLPKTCDLDIKKRYMHDGQNLFYDKWSFSSHSCKVYEMLDNLKLEEIILVTVDNHLKN